MNSKIILALVLIAAGTAQAQAQKKHHPGERAQPQPVAGQEGLTTAQYFECQIAARKATVVGMQERQQLVAKEATKEQKRQVGETSRSRVGLAHYQCGYAADALAAYAHVHGDELKAYLQANPQVQARLDEQARKVAQLSAQMPGTSPSAKR